MSTHSGQLHDLVDLILEHYEDLDARYKGLLPLRKVYVPEVLQDVGLKA